MASHSVAPEATDRRTVAAPDSFEAGALYRIGTKSDGPRASFSLGEKAPNGQRMASIYITAEDAYLSLNLDEETVTVISGEGDLMQAVEYDIDAAAMEGSEIRVGETFSVVFSYNDQQYLDETPIVTSWLATTGAQYPDLSDRLPEDTTVAIFDANTGKAKKRRRWGHASRAPQTATLVALHLAAQDAVSVDLTDDSLPEPVQLTDPQTGKTFVGRIWENPKHTTTARELVRAGYRLAVVEFVNGEQAILLPHYRGGLGIQIKTRSHMIERVLHESAMDTLLGAGKCFDTRAVSSFTGDRSQSGPFGSPPMKYVGGVGPEVEKGTVEYRELNFFREFRTNTKGAMKMATR